MTCYVFHIFCKNVTHQMRSEASWLYIKKNRLLNNTGKKMKLIQKEIKNKNGIKFCLLISTMLSW